MKKKLTYFTPAYNRAHTLPRLYESLVAQTNNNFVWLIIDDGSKDNTEELVKAWIEEGQIEIEYIKKENGGKHTAIDLSNQVCKTEYINCIDSDDYLSFDSTEVVLKYLDEVSADESLCGIVARRAHYGGKPFNESFPKKAEKLYFGELASKYGYTQDTNLIFKTAVVKNYHFPVFEDERFVTESVFYRQFMYTYKMMAIPELLYLAEYQEDGYSVQGLNLFLKNPKGFLCTLKQDVYFNIKHKGRFLRTIRLSASYYAWKRVFRIKTNVMPELKINWFYRLCGNLLKCILVPRYKAKFLEFKNNRKK